MEWLLVAFIAPMLWATVSVMDTYFVHGVYEDEYDGAVISGLLQLMPWIAVPLGLVEFQYPGHHAALLALVSGMFFLASFFCYFRSLFISNDTALIGILWNLSVLLVPFIAWLALSETLLPVHYLGILVAFIGILAFSSDKHILQNGFVRVLWLMSGAAFLISCSMVASKSAYASGADFWSVYLLFSVGTALMGGILFFLARRPTVSKRATRLLRMTKKYFWVFLLAEGLSTIGTLTSQWAISLAPSVSFVAVIESLVPVFVMLLSLMLVIVLRRADQGEIRLVYQQQFASAGLKIFGIITIGVGIFLISTV